MMLADPGSTILPGISDWVLLLNVPLSFAVILGFMRGWFVTGSEHRRVVTERDNERLERIKAQDALTERALPLLTENERTMAELVRAVDRIGRK